MIAVLASGGEQLAGIGVRTKRPVGTGLYWS